VGAGTTGQLLSAHHSTGCCHPLCTHVPPPPRYTPDPSWESYLATPLQPSYPSGHSTAAAAWLAVGVFQDACGPPPSCAAAVIQSAAIQC
jgi:membrane-associated phospholipid phosphatase